MPLHTSVAFDHWKLPGKGSVHVDGMSRLLRQPPRADAETQLESVPDRDRAAEERIRRDAEIALVEREPPGHAHLLRIGLDLRGRLQRARVAVQRDRDGERRPAVPR